MKIAVNHLARIEGHANLVIDSVRGTVRELRLEIVEAPRFFEPMLTGRHYSDVAHIAARICGICSNSHTLVSLQATEQALGIEVSEQTQSLRRLLAFGEILQSHLVQLFFMALPDYYGEASILPLVHTERALVQHALELKKLANDILRVVGGRPVHPVTPVVGGFARLPEAADLQELRRRLVRVLPDLEASVEIFGSLDYPDFERDTDCFSLRGGDDYPLFGRQLVSSGGVDCAVEDYRDVLEEYLVPWSTAKFARLQGRCFMVGPLARLRNNFDLLSPMARQVAEALGLTPDTANPYRILAARLVEVVHGVERAIHLIDELLLAGLQAEEPLPPQRHGRAVAVIEAPRGLLFHSYSYDAQGRIEQADCLIPTAQNLANIEADLRARVPELLETGREELTRQCEQLIRAYDPCISCSTHLLTIDFA
ncbi:coenzyme F420-reducing hydrogenase alpha subunit [Geothermobacter ehrlichii]|uniref:Coenzyme F420-reducing hydrogenase alpha subunit n=1 Tax=Geothermobacter ehrlichii TaxID=213224 RepID=A0A5D3WFJ0_9BACT|nr:Ni/Fe hydrogenase subunit alpha [Geothermobacter ehrlichii]TYO96626.1 coenzyme F420-reducing hydrogenase alpha subunit [Geothermobacter ehrlichii]